MPPLLITPGDPHGIGPEVVCKALTERLAVGEPIDAVIVGDREAMEAQAQSLGLKLRGLGDPGEGVALVTPSSDAEPIEAASIRWAYQACVRGEGSALVTGPINKQRLVERGFKHTGHTDFLGELAGTKPVMAFVGGKVRVALATVHVPLRRVHEVLTEQVVLHTIVTSAHALSHELGLDRGRIVVCGLNPHAGDGGVLGREEIDVIEPAVAEARAQGLNVVGPVSAETAFVQAVKGEVDLVVAMYHDQGLVPLKALDFGRSVNWTLGLPIIRTSVDHGTAYDIAGKRKADPKSFHQAVKLAEHLVERSRATRR